MITCDNLNNIIPKSNKTWTHSLDNKTWAYSTYYSNASDLPPGIKPQSSMEQCVAYPLSYIKEEIDKVWVDSCRKEKMEDHLNSLLKEENNNIEDNILQSKGESHMYEIKGYKKVAVITMGTSYSEKDYEYALYDEDIVPGDKVLVTGRASDKLWTVKEVIDAKDAECSKLTAEVICKVDTSKYEDRVEKRKIAATLLSDLEKKKKEIEARKDYEYYANLDPEFAEIYQRLKDLGV
jgi:hypothetical protein